MNKAYEIIDHNYDVVVIGAGGSGLRATLGVAALENVTKLPAIAP